MEVKPPAKTARQPAKKEAKPATVKQPKLSRPPTLADLHAAHAAAATARQAANQADRDATRIMQKMVDSGKYRAADLARELGVTRSAVSQRVRIKAR